jgi:hypothetical protein
MSVLAEGFSKCFKGSDLQQLETILRARGAVLLLSRQGKVKKGQAR